MQRSAKETDGYKFSMAEAGNPLRRETFYYSHRKGGWQFLPIDVEKFVRANLPHATFADYAYLDSHNYFLGGAFREAIQRHDEIIVRGLPKNSWFYNREPVFSVTGPQVLPSWLEPIVLQLNYRIQVATGLILRPVETVAKIQVVTCRQEKEIILETADSIRSHISIETRSALDKIRVESDEYQEDVLVRAKRLVSIVGDPDRLFEVGMRAVSCDDQHEIALKAIRETGIKRTSNVYLASKLDMIPVGTMGHEHVQRHGSDYAAYTAMRDRFPGFIFYLPDTFDTLASGIPSALRAMLDDPKRNSGIRFDSEHGIRGHYTYAINRCREMNLEPVLGLESGWNEKLTVEFENLRKMLGWREDRQAYGYGGYLVKPDWDAFGRDDVSAVWKICKTGDRPTMKFGDEPKSGKESIPGEPVLWRPRLGMANYSGPVGYVAQEGEDWAPPVPAVMVTGSTTNESPVTTETVKSINPSRGIAYSPATLALVDECRRQRAENISRAAHWRA